MLICCRRGGWGWGAKLVRQLVDVAGSAAAVTAAAVIAVAVVAAAAAAAAAAVAFNAVADVTVAVAVLFCFPMSKDPVSPFFSDGAGEKLEWNPAFFSA